MPAEDVTPPTRSRNSECARPDVGLWRTAYWVCIVAASGLAVATPFSSGVEAYRLTGLLVVVGCSQLTVRGVAWLVGAWIALSVGLLIQAPQNAWFGFGGWLVAVPLLSALSRSYYNLRLCGVQELSLARVDSELRRLKEAARTYRLLGGTCQRSPAAEGADGPDEPRLVQSSVQQIEDSQALCLSLLRQALGLRTVALYWLDVESSQYVLRGVSSGVKRALLPSHPLRHGIFAAVNSSGHPTVLRASKVRGEQTIYDSSVDCSVLAAVPVLEAERAVAVMVVEGERIEPPATDVIELVQATADSVVSSVRNERLFVQLEKTKTEQGKLYQAADQLSEAKTEAEVIRAGVSAARRFARFDFAAVTVFHPQANTHEICAASGELSASLIGEVFLGNTGLVAMAVENRHALPFRGEYEPEHQVVFDGHLQVPELESLIVLPLVLHEEPLGTLILGSREMGTFGEQTLPTLEVLARHVAVSLANARMVKRLEDLATTDGMTGLYNKRALTSLARQKIKSSQRFRKSISVIIGDIDYFKRVNDTYGHDVGDEVIKGFGDVLRRCKRETDIVGRFGGEEFVVVCEETDAAGAVLLAERIREELAQTVFHSREGSLSVTCSLGVATFPEPGSDWESLFKATDEALYVSKRSGRDRVSVWTTAMRGAAA